MIDPWLMGIALVSGLAYGFAGFGAALIFMPVALLLVEPVVALEPLGVWVLRTTEPMALRGAVSTVVLGTLAALLSGWRYRQSPGLPA